jgi:hypothetical protein
LRDFIAIPKTCAFMYESCRRKSMNTLDKIKYNLLDALIDKVDGKISLECGKTLEWGLKEKLINKLWKKLLWKFSMEIKDEIERKLNEQETN